MQSTNRVLFISAALLLVFFTSFAVAGEVQKVNINKAPLEVLSTMKGVGSATAKKIVEYREKNGPFKAPEDIMKVKGVGKKIWEENSKLIVIN